MSFRQTYGKFLLGDASDNNFVLDNFNEPEVTFYGASTGAGNDTVTLNGNFDARINTGTGDDEVNIYNESGQIEVRTEHGNDKINAYVGDDAVLNVYAGEGEDDIYFLGKNSNIFGGRGKDYISLETAVIQNELHVDPFVVNAIGNYVEAGMGDDVISIDAGSKNNKLSGGQGDDIFVFKNKLPAFIANEKEFFDPSQLELIQGTNTITDFELNNPNEKIDLQDWDETSFEDLDISQDGENTKITNAQGQTIILQGIIPSQLSSDNFIFRIQGDDNNNILDGRKFVGTINGGAGNDIISTEVQDATFTGGEGSDRFVISKMDDGQVVEITDFEINNHNEKIVLKDFDNLNFDDLKIEYLDDVDGLPAALITLSDNQAIFVRGVTKDSPLTANNFDLGNETQEPDPIFSDGDDTVTISLPYYPTYPGIEGAYIFGNFNLDGKEGNDTVIFESLNNIVFDLTDTHIENVVGGDGKNYINASNVNWNVNITGGEKNDILIGGLGNDKLTGGNEGDSLFGGAGEDQFNYAYANESNSASGADHIKDFAQGEDKINFSEMNKISNEVRSNIEFSIMVNATPPLSPLQIDNLLLWRGFYSFNEINKQGESNDINSLVYYYDEQSGNTVIESQNHFFQLNVAGQIDFNNGDFIF